MVGCQQSLKSWKRFVQSTVGSVEEVNRKSKNVGTTERLLIAWRMFRKEWEM